MKIAIWHNLPSGGGKRALYDQVRGLAARGHTLEVWCPATADQSYLPLGQIIPEHRLPLEWPPARSRNPLRRIARPYQELIDKLAAIERHCRACATAINRGGFDLLFANACQFLRVTPIGRFAQPPGLLYLQEPYRWLYEALPQLPWAAPAPDGANWWRAGQLKRRLRDELQTRALRIQVREERRNAEAFDTILVNSLFSRESVLRAYGLGAKVCYLGIDTELFERRALPKEDFVVGIGALVREKNIEFIIEAVGAIAQPRPRLVWIGNVAVPSYLAWIQQLATARGVAFEARVRLSDAELRDTLGRAIAMVYAPRLEPFGLAPLEANACGLPVIAVAEGGVRETVIDGVNGLLVEPEPAAMARAIERLRDDPAEAERLGASAYRLVHERWSLPASIDRLEARLIETLERAPARPASP